MQRPLENKKLRRTMLDNGLRVLLSEDHSVPIVTTFVCYAVGSRVEGEGTRGVSHLLEHLMFKGTDRYGKGEIDDITTRNGGSNNAFTSLDSTAYYFSFASDRWLSSLEIESNRMQRLRLDASEFEAERRVVLEELKMELDSPWGGLRQEVERASFAGHPYRYPVIGLRSDIQHLTRDQVLGHYESFYVPNNAVLVVVGDFESDRALERIEELFGPIPSRPVPHQLPGGGGDYAGPIELEVQRHARLSRLQVAFPAPAVGDPDHFALQVADKLLNEGKLSRFYRSLVEQEEIATEVWTEFAETLDPFLYSIRLELHSDVEPEKAVSRLNEQIRSLESLDETDLTRARNQCVTQVLQETETTLDRAAQIGLLEVIGASDYWPSFLDRIEGVSLTDVQRYARRYLDPDRAVVGISRRNDGRQSQIDLAAL